MNLYVYNFTFNNRVRTKVVLSNGTRAQVVGHTQQIKIKGYKTTSKSYTVTHHNYLIKVVKYVTFKPTLLCV